MPSVRVTCLPASLDENGPHKRAVALARGRQAWAAGAGATTCVAAVACGATAFALDAAAFLAGALIWLTTFLGAAGAGFLAGITAFAFGAAFAAFFTGAVATTAGLAFLAAAALTVLVGVLDAALDLAAGFAAFG